MNNVQYIPIKGTIAERKAQEAARVKIANIEAAVDYISMMTGIDIYEAEEEKEDEELL